jgi:hypothetical protein
MKNIHKISVVKPGGKKPVRRSGRRWKTKKMNHKEVGCEDVDCIHLRITGFWGFSIVLHYKK